MGGGQSIMEAGEAITSRGLQLLGKHLICALKTVSAWCGGRASLIRQTAAGLRGRLSIAAIW